MNDFKRRTKVEPEERREEKKKSFCIEEKKTDFLTIEEKKKNDILRIIFKALNRQPLTKEEKENLLKVEESESLSSIHRVLLCMAKEYVKTGKMTRENYEKYIVEIQTEEKVSLGQAIGEKLEKSPEAWEK